MLQKHIQKIINKLPKAKRESQVSNALLSSKELYYDPDPIPDKIDANYLTERKDVISLSPSRTAFSKRHSIFMSRYSQDNKMFSSELIETKNKRIKELETKLKDISDLLFGLASSVKSSLILEEVSFFFFLRIAILSIF